MTVAKATFLIYATLSIDYSHNYVKILNLTEEINCSSRIDSYFNYAKVLNNHKAIRPCTDDTFGLFVAFPFANQP